MTPNFNLAATVGFIDPFRAANYLDGSILFRWDTASATGGEQIASNGLSINTLALRACRNETYDIVIVSSSWAPKSYNSVPLHGALQRWARAALWREALHLVQTGVASVKDVDTAVWAGPGLRWAAMGPTMLFHLGAGAGGITAFCERYTPSFNRWWDDLGTLHLDGPLAEQLTAGMAKEVGGRTPADLAAKRDALIIAMQKSMAPLR